MDKKILLRFWHYPVMTLGPGRRLGIWFQGCSIHCAGCIAPENQAFDKNFAVPLENFFKEIQAPLSDAEGVTISGGEPFDQAPALFELLKFFKAQGQEDILIYSGYLNRKILSEWPEIKNFIAALVDGPFIAGAVTESRWKGSENQELTIFNKSLVQKYSSWINDSSPRKLQLVKKFNGHYLIGIPEQKGVNLN